MRIIGLDIGRGVAFACLLESFPVNIQRHYKNLKNQKKFYKLTTSQSGVDRLLSLSPDAIVLEPSGHWYAHFWVTVAKAYRIDIYWVGHSDLDKQRGSYGFTNKRDEEDALCLAATYFDDRFIDENGKIQKRDRSLRKFQAFLGLSYSYKQSGDKKSRKFHGSSIARAHLYAWAVCMVAPSKNGNKINGEIGNQLSDRYQELRQSVKGKDSLIRILFKATRMLYYELLDELYVR